jgi:monoamine oxidase
VGYATTGTLSALSESLRAPHGLVHWAGSETAAVWLGYMEGAVESGERVANEISKLLPAKS